MPSARSKMLCTERWMILRTVFLRALLTFGWRAIFWAGLLANTRGVTLERAGAILDQADSEYSSVLGIVYGELLNSFIMRIAPPYNDEEDEAKNAEGTA